KDGKRRTRFGRRGFRWCGGVDAASVRSPWPYDNRSRRAKRGAPLLHVGELLNPLAFVGLGDEEVTARVDGEIVRAVELARPVSRAPERRDHLERLATQDVDLLVRAVDHDGEPLRGVGREADVPYRSAAEGLLRDERFLDERSVGLEDLQPVVRAIADV